MIAMVKIISQTHIPGDDDARTVLVISVRCMSQVIRNIHISDGQKYGVIHFKTRQMNNRKDLNLDIYVQVIFNLFISSSHFSDIFNNF